MFLSNNFIFPFFIPRKDCASTALTRTDLQVPLWVAPRRQLHLSHQLDGLLKTIRWRNKWPCAWGDVYTGFLIRCHCKKQWFLCSVLATFIPAWNTKRKHFILKDFFLNLFLNFLFYVCPGELSFAFNYTPWFFCNDIYSLVRLILIRRYIFFKKTVLYNFLSFCI